MLISNETLKGLGGVLMWWMAAGCLVVWQLGGRSCCRTLQSRFWCCSIICLMAEGKQSVGGVLWQWKRIGMHSASESCPGWRGERPLWSSQLSSLCIAGSLQFPNHSAGHSASVEGGKDGQWLSSVSAGSGGIDLPFLSFGWRVGVERPSEVVGKDTWFSWPLSIVEPLMNSREWSAGVLLRSTTISLVVSTLRDRLLSLHQLTSCSTSSLYDVSSLLFMRPITVMSLALLMIWLDSNLPRQLWVSSVNSSGLRTHPRGVPVLSMMVPDVQLPMRTAYGLSVTKSRIKFQREVSRPSKECFSANF